MMRGQVLARRPDNEHEDYLRAGEAAEILHVSPKTMSRWAKEGRVPHIVTLGGHRRFSRTAIQDLAQRMFGNTA
jgi:excisionase family DNA binding protein